jgi:hypothetical protein
MRNKQDIIVSEKKTSRRARRVGCSKPIKFLKKCLLRMINVVDKTSFSPNLNNKTTSVAGIYQSIIQPHYLIKSMIFGSKFNEVIRLFLYDITLLLRCFVGNIRLGIRFHFSMFEHPTLRDLPLQVIYFSFLSINVITCF